MPDTFFRTFMCGAAVVAVGAGAFIVTGRDASLEKEANTVYPAQSSPTKDAGHGFVRAQSVAILDDSYTEPSSAASVDVQSVSDAVCTGHNAQLAHNRASTASSDMATGKEPVIFVGKDAIEVSVPIDPQSGQSAYVPIALALAADPAGVPPQLQEAAREMALDFLEDVADAAAVATTAQNADYFSRWQDAAYLSDRAFKMRYGRVAYVQMNQLLAQEAAAGVR